MIQRRKQNSKLLNLACEIACTNGSNIFQHVRTVCSRLNLRNESEAKVIAVNVPNSDKISLIANVEQ